MREISVLKQIHHPNIIRLFKCFLHKKSIFLVFEFVDFDLGKLLCSLDQEVILSSLQIKVIQKIKNLTPGHNVSNFKWN